MNLQGFLFSLIAAATVGSAAAGNVKLTMNTVSTTMTLAEKESGKPVDVGTPDTRVYNFSAPAGDYILTAYGTNGTTVNGTIELNLTDDDQELTIITCTAYASNKHADGSAWTIENGDYSLDISINTREGKTVNSVAGNSVTANRYTFLAFSGNSYSASFVPSAALQAEGYTTLYKGGTLTANVNVTGAIPLGEDYSVTLPADAGLQLGVKFTHFTDFTPVEPKSEVVNGDTKSVTYYLAQGQVYNYRTWRKGGLTQGGYFTMSADADKRPQLSFADADYKAFDPKAVNHDVNSNLGYETGDIFVNINERGHLDLNVGDTFKAHAMRSWELTDNSTSNYFIEPDFHYTVLDLDGKPSTGVIEIDNADSNVSAWAEIKGVGKGTAIVLVTYDAIGLNYYSSAGAKAPFLGGEFWGAIWPENTAAYVVTVGEGTSAVEPNMIVNADYNKEALKMSGKYVDAEHDVFYYLDSEEGAYFTFTPEGVASVSIAYPTIGERMATYSGFTTDGVSRNADGSYTLLLKEGRQIVKLTDNAGKSVYQVLTAKPCHREIVNSSRPGSKIFQPGDEVKIQYSGLRHPANKLAGIYNMSAFVTYNGVPNGSSLVLGSGQYTFGSSASAQGVTVSIPEDHDVAAEPEIVLSDGVIQVNGYGDPIGNHRYIDPVAGRSPNFTAVAHKTYFGAIPDVHIALSPVKNFDVKLECNVPDAEITVTYCGKVLSPDDGGLYSGSYGIYSVKAAKPGFICYRHDFNIPDDAEGLQTFSVDMTADEKAWDGKTLTEPQLIEGVYQISTGAELAWLANHINSGNATVNAAVTDDLQLGGYDWTPAGTSSKPFSGNFDGQGHRIDGLYIDKATATYQGLFGYLKTGTISGVEVHGQINAKSYIGGIVAYMHQNSLVDRCANYVDITATSTYIGGITGYLSTATSKITNCYNAASVSGTTNCGGITGNNNKDAVVENVFNVGQISGTTVGAIAGGTTAKDNYVNAFAVEEYGVTAGQTTVSQRQMRSGEVAFRLGKAFGQNIGEEDYPVLGGKEVFYNELVDAYFNDFATGVDNVESTPEIEAYYNLQGLRSSTPWQGLNIIRYTDGSIRKAVIK